MFPKLILKFLELIHTKKFTNQQIEAFFLTFTSLFLHVKKCFIWIPFYFIYRHTHTHTHTHTRPVPGPMVDTKIWGCSCSIAGPSCLQMWIQPTLDHKHDPWGTRYVVSLSTDVEPINTEGLPCFYWKKIYTLNPYCSKVNAVCVCMYVYIPFCKQKYKHTRKGNMWGCSHWSVLPALEICIWLCLSSSTLNFITATDCSCKAKRTKLLLGKITETIAWF